MAILTTPTDAELAEFFARYDLPKIEQVEALEVGTVNSSFRVLAKPDTRLFLRIYEEQDERGARREAGLLSAISRAGVVTPSPLAMRDGEAIGALAGKPAALFPWVDGTMRCQASVTPAHTRAVGQALARVHLAARGAEAVAGRFERSDLHARIDRIAACPRPELAALAPGLRASLDRWHAARDPSLPRGLVHGDLFRDNVLWNEREEISALLDFESASDGTYAYDLMVTVLAWCVSDDLDASLARALVQGYAEVRPLEERERAGLLAEGCCAALRFTITRITDRAMRGLTGIKDYRRFRMRRERLEAMGAEGLRGMLGV